MIATEKEIWEKQIEYSFPHLYIAEQKGFTLPPPQENNYLKSKNHVPRFINIVSMVLTTSGASSKRPTVTHKKHDKQHCYTQWHGTCAFYVCVYTCIHIDRQTGIYLYIFLLVCFTMKSQHPCIFLMDHLRNLLSHSQVFQGCLKQTMRRKLLLKELILNS